jgi:hypothetical protein
MVVAISHVEGAVGEPETFPVDKESSPSQGTHSCVKLSNLMGHFEGS